MHMFTHTVNVSACNVPMPMTTLVCACACCMRVSSFSIGGKADAHGSTRLAEPTSELSPSGTPFEDRAVDATSHQNQIWPRCTGADQHASSNDLGHMATKHARHLHLAPPTLSEDMSLMTQTPLRRVRLAAHCPHTVACSGHPAAKRAAAEAYSSRPEHR